MAHRVGRLLGRSALSVRRQWNGGALLARYNASTGAAGEDDGKSVKDAEDVAAAESKVYEEVSYVRRRVMPLPEDRPEEVVEVEAQGQGTVRRTVRRMFTPAATFDSDLPLPKLAPPVERKKMDPVSLTEAIRLVKANARAKFNETVEVHIRLGIDPKRSDQSVRGAVTLPNGSGKAVRVAVFADGDAAEEALAAGADVVGSDDLVNRIMSSGGKLDFEKCIAIPSMMPKLGKIARILGPRGLMPNPKVGSVTSNVAEAVKAAKQGRVDFKADRTAIIHAGLGKVNFTDEALLENISAFAGAVLAAKPAGLKKSSKYIGFFSKFHLTSTMGSGVPVTIQSVATAADQYMKAQA